MKERVFLNSMYQCIISIQKLIEKYEQYALLNNETEIAHTLHTIKTEGAQNFRQALQLLRILHFSIWKAGNYHNTLARILSIRGTWKMEHSPKKKHSIGLKNFSLYAIGTATRIQCMQQGYNGQSLVFVGRDPEGQILIQRPVPDALQASYELKLIIPKINIRVDPTSTLGSRLTK